jgi:hypothetical protein
MHFSAGRSPCGNSPFPWHEQPRIVTVYTRQRRDAEWPPRPRALTSDVDDFHALPAFFPALRVFAIGLVLDQLATGILIVAH